MTDVEAHPTANRLSAYVQGRLDEPETDELEHHLSSCDSCCRWIREQPEDSLVAKLRNRGAANYFPVFYARRIARIFGRKTFKTPLFAWLGIRRTEFKRPAHFWPVLPDGATRM